MKKIIFFCLVLTACATADPYMAVMPVPPAAPKIRHPEKMDDADKKNLADFYKLYKLYLDKLKIWVDNSAY